MDTSALRQRYEELKVEATKLAGGLLDIPRRVIILNDLYADSQGNHAFSLLAAHGALWSSGYFEVGGSLGRLIAHRYFYNSTERAYRLGLLDEFAAAFRRVNRLVCIDTYTNYYFTKEYGTEPGSREILPESLLSGLNFIHSACHAGRTLTPSEKRSIFEQSFRCEQEHTVAPGVETAVAAFQCRIMKFLVLHPVVRFSYFPWGRYLLFRNFADKSERIDKGMQAYDHAASMGWPHVHSSLRRYRIMPEAFFQTPNECLAAIRNSLDSD